MEFNYGYRFTQKANEDLNKILAYISNDLASPQAAQKLAERIFEHIDNVRIFPNSGTLVQNEFLTDKTIRTVLVDNYILYYKIAEVEKDIYVLRIVYGRRNLSEILKTI